MNYFCYLTHNIFENNKYSMHSAGKYLKRNYSSDVKIWSSVVPSDPTIGVGNVPRI